MTVDSDIAGSREIQAKMLVHIESGGWPTGYCVGTLRDLARRYDCRSVSTTFCSALHPKWRKTNGCGIRCAAGSNRPVSPLPPTC